MEDGGVVLMDLLWSDPTTNDGVEGVQPSPRGPGLVTFGPDRVKEFCKVCLYIPVNPNLLSSLTTALLPELCSVALDSMSTMPPKIMLQQSHAVHCAGAEIVILAQVLLHLLQLLPTVGRSSAEYGRRYLSVMLNPEHLCVSPFCALCRSEMYSMVV